MYYRFTAAGLSCVFKLGRCMAWSDRRGAVFFPRRWGDTVRQYRKPTRASVARLGKIGA